MTSGIIYPTKAYKDTLLSNKYFPKILLIYCFGNIAGPVNHSKLVIIGPFGVVFQFTDKNWRVTIIAPIVCVTHTHTVPWDTRTPYLHTTIDWGVSAVRKKQERKKNFKKNNKKYAFLQVDKYMHIRNAMQLLCCTRLCNCFIFLFFYFYF